MKIVRPNNYIQNNLLLTSKKQEPNIIIGSKKIINNQKSNSQGRKRGISLSKEQKVNLALFQSKKNNKKNHIIKKKPFQSPQIRLQEVKSTQSLMKQPYYVMTSLNPYQNKNLKYLKTVRQTPVPLQIQYVSENEHSSLQNNRIILSTKNYKTVNPPSQQFQQNRNNLFQSQRQNKFICNTKEQNYLHMLPHSLSKNRKFQLASSTSKQNKFQYGFQQKQKPVLIKIERKPQKLIQNKILYNDYLNQNIQTHQTKKSKDTCECNSSSNKSSIKIGLENSVRSTATNQENKLTCTVRGSTKSIWDAYKTQSIVSQRFQEDNSQRSIVQPLNFGQKYRNYIIEQQKEVKNYKKDEINFQSYFKAADSYFQII